MDWQKHAFVPIAMLGIVPTKYRIFLLGTNISPFRLPPSYLSYVTMALLLEWAKVAELVDALDLGSSAARRESSSLSFRTSTLPVSRIMRGAKQKGFCLKTNGLLDKSTWTAAPLRVSQRRGSPSRAKRGKTRPMAEVSRNGHPANQKKHFPAFKY